MKVYLKQNITLFFKAYEAYDSSNNLLYIVKQKRSQGRLFKFYDKFENELGSIEEKALYILHEYYIYHEYKLIGSIKQKRNGTYNDYDMDFLGWRIEGTPFAWHFIVYDEKNKVISQIDKKAFKSRNTYELDILNENNSLFLVMLCVALDTIHFG